MPSSDHTDNDDDRATNIGLRTAVGDGRRARRLVRTRAEEGRADDNPEAFKTRLAAYERQTAPLLPYYEAQGRLFEVDGMGSVEQVAAEIDAALGPAGNQP